MYFSMQEVPDQTLFNTYRVTVGIMLIVDRRGIILVQPQKGTGMEWILPQGGVSPGETFNQAMIREVAEELPGATLQLPKPFLGKNVNKLPPERGNLDKLIFWFGAFVKTLPIGVNEVENRGYCIVHRRDHLEHTLCAARPEKRQMILDVVKEARQSNLLDW